MASSSIDYSNIDYRGFIFVVHEQYGLMLLHCTRKPKKGPHFQLPGGHVDDFEFQEAAKTSGGNAQTQLLEAAKAGAARELWEETGVDVRNQLGRLQPAALKSSNTATALSCEIKHRLFFFLAATDADFLSADKTSEQLVGPLGAEGRHLKIKYSVEHSGFDFEKDPSVSVQKLKKHSGGVPSQALAMAMARDANKSKSRDAGAVASSPKITGKTERRLDHLEEVEDPPVLLGADRRAKDKEKAASRAFAEVAFERMNIV
eukprot:CAMPEP_0181063700 /NCGR_PEP_ID=MMETSP1070-20121207/23787_1 /TAXON_ID=265543 /ORGANISM="Minutocellus polymorphus, Strain NH13" /LENGTH=259 /DNA_ID=CAMNT_0023143925 /DNA_START=1 /DNA_END=781 /DNA_ORIENTATION=+